MQWLYYEYWKNRDDKKRIRKAFMLSIIVHLLIFVPFLFFKFRTPEAIPIVYQVSLESPVSETPIEPPKPEPPKPEPPKPEPPKPEPPKPEPPKPEPPKAEPPKAEPVKQEPPKKPELPKEEKPKPEKEKQPKPEKKDPPKKEEKPKEEKPEPSKSNTKPQQVDKRQQLTTATAVPKAEMTNQLPPELEWWARQVQRKIDSVWVVPEGIKVDAENNVAEVSFWVNREGQLVEPPKVTKEASDPELGESGVRAIMLAAPFPKLPDNYPNDEQLVVYSFSLQ